RDGQLPHPLPGERCVCAAEEAECLWLDFSIRGPGQRVSAAFGRAVLPMSLSRATATGDGAELCRGGRPGGAARDHWRDAGDRGVEAGAWDRQFFARAAVVVRCAGNEVSRDQT